MSLRRVFKWLLGAVILSIAAALGVLAWLWSHSDELLRDRIAEALRRAAPEWSIQFDRVGFDLQGRIRLEGVSAKLRNEAQSVLTVREAVVFVDRDRLLRSRDLKVERIHLHAPEATVRRDAQGRWSWEKFPPLRLGKHPPPVCSVENGTLHLRLERPATAPPLELTAQELALTITPQPQRAVSVEASTRIEQLGDFRFTAQWDLEAKAGRIEGTLDDLIIDQDVAVLMTEVVPQLRTRLAEFNEALAAFRPNAAGNTVAQPASNVPHRSVAAVRPLPDRGGLSVAIPELGLTAHTRIDFALNTTVRSATSDPDGDRAAAVPWKLLFTLQGGRCVHPAMPLPLEDLRGRIYCDPRGVLFRNVEGHFGATRVGLDGQVLLADGGPVQRLELSISQWPLDQRTQERLPPEWQRAFALLNPRGTVDAELLLESMAGGRWHLEGTVRPRGCSITHALFPYPVQDVTGTIRINRNEKVAAELEGRAGLQPVRITAQAESLDRTAAATCLVEVDQLPIDSLLLSACSPAMRHVLNSVGIAGSMDVRLRLDRNAGPDARFRPSLAARLRDCALECVVFPYRLSRVNGLVTYADDRWEFREFTGAHGPAVVSGGGHFDPQENEPLHLEISARDARFDGELEHALPASIRTVWDVLSPSGEFDVQAHITQDRQGQVRIAIDRLTTKNAGIVLRGFPYPLRQVAADVSWIDGRLTISSFRAVHGKTHVVLEGFGELPPEGPWRIRFSRLTVENLLPDRPFREALPQGLREVVEQLDPRGFLTLDGMAEVRGSGRSEDPLTAAWHIDASVEQARLAAGVDLDAIRGTVTTSGSWDGQRVEMNGWLDLDSVEVLDHEFVQVRGPFRVSGNQLTVGSPKILLDEGEDDKSDPVPLSERVTASIMGRNGPVGGLVALDAAVALDPQPAYHVKLVLWRADLARYAARYLPDAGDIEGTVYGWIDVHGRGDDPADLKGHGQLQVSPAALYELPVIAQVLSVLQVRIPDRTAFRYAFLDFDVGGEKFNFNVINLIGDTISLHGRGYIRFSGSLHLDFYSMLSRSQLPVPVIKYLTQGWVRVKVRGTVGSPDAEIKPFAQLDDALKGFLGALEKQARQPLPPLRIPPALLPPTGPSRPPENRQPTPRRWLPR